MTNDYKNITLSILYYSTIMSSLWKINTYICIYMAKHIRICIGTMYHRHIKPPFFEVLTRIFLEIQLFHINISVIIVISTFSIKDKNILNIYY